MNTQTNQNQTRNEEMNVFILLEHKKRRQKTNARGLVICGYAFKFYVTTDTMTSDQPMIQIKQYYNFIK